MELKFYIGKDFKKNNNTYLFCGDINNEYAYCVIHFNRCVLEPFEQNSEWYFSFNEAYLDNVKYINKEDFDYDSIMFEIENRIKNADFNDYDFEQFVDEVIGIKNVTEISDKELKNIIIDYSIPSESSLKSFEYQLEEVTKQYNKLISIENRLSKILR